MKRLLTHPADGFWALTYVLASACLIVAGVSAQTSEPVFVLQNGSGETTYAPVKGIDYSHHTNYMMTLQSLSVKWELRLLLGEPVVNGVFKWTAGKGMPADYLDYRDYVLLECMPKKSVGYQVYIPITPTVPKSGEGYGFNTPGSPSWKSVFCTRDGKDMTAKVPGFTAETAKEIWKNGFYVTGVVLSRQGGKDGYLNASAEARSAEESSAEAPSANATSAKITSAEASSAEASSAKATSAEIKKQEDAVKRSRAKYEALKNPFTLAVHNRDTVYSKTIRPVTYLHPWFAGTAVKLSIANKEFVSSTSSINADLVLAPGWNTFVYSFTGKGVEYTDSLYVFYSREEPVLFEDDFNDGVLDGRWITDTGTEKIKYLAEENGALILKGGGLVNGPVLRPDPHKRLIIEVRSLNRSVPCYYPGDVLIRVNNRYGFRCRKECTEANVKIICDLSNGTMESYLDGVWFETYSNLDFEAEEGIQVGLSCRYSESWEVDGIKIYQ